MRQKKRFSRQVDKTRINEDIREQEIRVIDQNGDHLGVISVEEALNKATESGLDLVEVAAGSKPHVCRIMDYGHYKFEQAKRQKLAKKKQKVIVLKEIKMRPRTDDHDYDFKMNHAKKFLGMGFKVKFTVLFRGRELAHKDRGRMLLERVEQDLLDFAAIESKPKFEGRTMHMVVAPTAKPKNAAKPEFSDEDLPSEDMDSVETVEENASAAE